MRRIAEGFHFSGGEKVIHQSQENKGLSGSWREAWTCRDRELFVILEDDVEVSAHWYRAAVNMWQVPVNISQYQSISVSWSKLVRVGQFVYYRSTAGGNMLEVWACRTRSSVSLLRMKGTTSQRLSGLWRPAITEYVV